MVFTFLCFLLKIWFCACSGHPNKSRVVNYQLLAIFTFTPCQRGVNHPATRHHFWTNCKNQQTS